jgi:hypothetical protein
LSYPRKIHILWYQGFEEAPELVKMNYFNHLERQKGFEINFYDSRDVHKLLEKYKLNLDKLSFQAIADIFRIKILIDHGGYWLDSTVFINSALEDFISHEDKSPFLFRNPAPDRPIANWFIGANIGDALLNIWFEAALKFFSEPRLPAPSMNYLNQSEALEDFSLFIKNKQYPYFWPHYLYAKLLEEDQYFRKLDSFSLNRMDAEDSFRLSGFIDLNNRGEAEMYESKIAFILEQRPIQKLYNNRNYCLSKIFK